jgi:sec-independent protein translocase protein TatA
MDPLALMMDIAGTEWIIIVLLGLILIFGTKKLPQFSRSMGKAVGEYEKARKMFRQEMEATAERAMDRDKMPKIDGPVASEREKLETIASSLGIENYSSLADEELRNLIAKRMVS